MKEYVIYLRDMLEHAKEAGEIARAKGNDRLRKLAIERALIVIAEAAKQVPRDIQPDYPQVPWKDIIDLRNAIAHGYDQHTLAELEAMATEEVQDIAEILHTILAQHGE